MHFSTFTPSNPARIYLIGYFGYRNMGDDLMLEALLDQFEASPAVAKVTVDMNEDTIGAWPGKSSPITGTGLLAKAKRLTNLVAANCLVWGGGTCLYDAGDNSGMVRLLRYAKLAKKLGKPFFMLNIGIGRLDSKESRELAAAILGQAEAVTFRDLASFNRAKSLTPAGNYKRGGDLATLCPLPVMLKKADEIKTVAFSGVREAIGDQAIVRAMAASLENLVAQGVKIKFIPFHGGSHSDHIFHKAVAASLPLDSYTLVEADTASEVLDALRHVDFHIGMRLHSVVVADLIGLPGIGLAYHPKVSYYLERQGAAEREVSPSVGFSFDFLKAILGSYQRPGHTLAEEQNAALAGLRPILPPL